MAEAVSVGAPPPRVRKVDLDRPWAWLAAGWHDLTQAPGVSLAYGVLFAVIGWAVTFGLWWAGMIYLILPLTAGFLIMGTILAVGLYEVSRRHEQGRWATFGDAIAAFRTNPSQIAFMGVTLLLLFFAWIRIAVMIFFLFFGLEPPNPEAFIGIVFFSAGSLPFLIVGTIAGALLAALAFALSAISIPLLLDREQAHVVTAITASFRAIYENPSTMTFWGVLIVLFAGAGLITFYVGLIITLPLIGHASWARLSRSRPMVTEEAGAAMGDDNIGPWILGGAMALLSLFGLLLASAAEDRVFSGTGLILFGFGVLFIFGLIHRYVGR